MWKASSSKYWSSIFNFLGATDNTYSLRASGNVGD